MIDLYQEISGFVSEASPSVNQYSIEKLHSLLNNKETLPKEDRILIFIIECLQEADFGNAPMIIVSNKDHDFQDKFQVIAKFMRFENIRPINNSLFINDKKYIFMNKDNPELKNIIGNVDIDILYFEE